MAMLETDKLIETILNHLKLNWKRNSMGYWYSTGPNKWVHFNPFTRDADAMLMMVEAQINVVWDNEYCYVTKNQFARTGSDWRSCIAVVYINYMNHKKAVINKDVFTEVHISTKV